MRSVETTANEVVKHKNKLNDIAKQKNKGKRGQEAYEQRQLRLLSTRSRANEVPKKTNKCK